MSNSFPIVRTVVYRGHDYEKRLDESDTVKCWFCGNEFKLNWRTVYMAPDDMEMVRCPQCKKEATVLYYFDHVVNTKAGKPKQHRKNHKETRIYHHAEKEITE